MIVTYRSVTAEWDGEYIYLPALVRGGIGWTEYASTWVEAIRALRRAVLTA